MNSISSPLAALPDALRAVAAAVGAAPAVGDRERATTAVLFELASDWAGHAADADRGAILDALCRKVQVANKVSDRYAMGSWRPVKGSQPLDAAGWRLLVAVLVLESWPALAVDGVAPPAGLATSATPAADAFGRALKCLCAALVAADKATAAGVELDPIWRAALAALPAAVAHGGVS